MFDSTDLIYVKIAKELCVEILGDPDAAGSKVPSVRDLSKEKRVNANTIQKAYQYLDDLGIFKSETGLGRFVTTDTNKIEEVKRELFISELKRVKVVATKYNISIEEVIEEYKKLD